MIMFASSLSLGAIFSKVFVWFFELLLIGFIKRNLFLYKAFILFFKHHIIISPVKIFFMIDEFIDFIPFSQSYLYKRKPHTHSLMYKFESNLILLNQQTIVIFWLMTGHFGNCLNFFSESVMSMRYFMKIKHVRSVNRIWMHRNVFYQSRSMENNLKIYILFVLNGHFLKYFRSISMHLTRWINCATDTAYCSPYWEIYIRRESKFKTRCIDFFENEFIQGWMIVQLFTFFFVRIRVLSGIHTNIWYRFHSIHSFL